MKTTNYTITTITAMNNTAVAMFANKKYIYKTAENNKVALLETFKAILTKALPNDQLMEKPVLIITTQSILKGFTTNGYIEYLRTGADASGKPFSAKEMQLVKECAELYASRVFNVRLIDEKMVSAKDREAITIKQNAFETAKLLSKQRAVADTKEEIKQQPTPETNATIALLNAELQKAIKAGNIQLASEYSKMIAQLTNPAPQETNEVEVPADETTVEEEIDPTADADEIDM